jgi:hypothetical protein
LEVAVVVVAGGGGVDMGGGTEGGREGCRLLYAFLLAFLHRVFRVFSLSRSPSSRWVFLLSLSFLAVQEWVISVTNTNLLISVYN